MGILNILFRNTGQKARTLRPSEQSTPGGYRGALEHEVSLCTGCGTCGYVCSPGAITINRQAGGITWQYQAVRCTFCSRCAEYCPTHAIHLADTAPVSAVEQAVGTPGGLPGALATHHMVDYQPCERCGQPFVPLPAPVLAHLTGREVGPDMAALMRLCEKCRARVTSQRFKDSLTGHIHTDRS